MDKYASRAGLKLEFALDKFKVSVKDLSVADFGSSTGGFVDCLLQSGAKKVYSVDTSYGELAWKLRNDPKVVVIERTNAMHVNLAEKVDFISIDTGWTKQKSIIPNGWTKQKSIIPNALANLKPGGTIITLIKPHYEAPREYLVKGKLLEEKIDEVLESVKKDIENLGVKVIDMAESPIEGAKGKNKEFLALIKL